MFALALRRDPKAAADLANGHRYNAACVAVLAGCGKGKDDPAPDDDVRAGLRRQAMEWLRADLDAWGKIPESDGERGIAMLSTLRHWKEDSDLAGLRDERELVKLAEEERDRCHKLWAEADALVRRAAVGMGQNGLPARQFPGNPFAN